MTRAYYHNQNTHMAGRAILQRSYDVPTSWTPPAPAGIRAGGTNYITLLLAPTPVRGVGDPRVRGKRTVQPGNTRYITG